MGILGLSFIQGELRLNVLWVFNNYSPIYQILLILNLDEFAVTQILNTDAPDLIVMNWECW